MLFSLPLHFYFAVLLLSLLGCASPQPFQTVSWTEQVRLSSGTEISVERKTVPGAVWYNDHGQAFYRPEQVLTLPDGTQWDSASLNPTATSAEVAMVERDAKGWFLVVAPVGFSGDQVRYGCLVPNLLYFRYVSKQWVRATSVDVPDGIQFNLLLLMQRGRDRTLSGYLTIEEKTALKSSWFEDARRIWYVGPTTDWSGSNPLMYLMSFSKKCDPSLSNCKPAC